MNHLQINIPHFIVGALLLFIIHQTVMAQQLENDLHKIYGQITDQNKFYSKMRLSVYKNEASEKPHLINEYLIKQDGTSFFYSLGGSDYLFNDRCALVIDNTDRFIHYSTSEKASTEMNPVPDPEQLLKSIDSAVFKGVEDGYKWYVIYDYDGVIPVTDLFIDEKQNCFHKLVYHYNSGLAPENNKVVIEYLEWDIQPDFKENEFSEWNYLIKTKGKLQPASAYNGYTFLENEQTD